MRTQTPRLRLVLLGLLLTLLAGGVTVSACSKSYTAPTGT